MHSCVPTVSPAIKMTFSGVFFVGIAFFARLVYFYSYTTTGLSTCKGCTVICSIVSYIPISLGASLRSYRNAQWFSDRKHAYGDTLREWHFLWIATVSGKYCAFFPNLKYY